MRKFTRRTYANDKIGYDTLIQQRDAARHNLEYFVKQWIAPAKQKKADELIRELVYTHQQTVSYQTEHEVDERDIDIY